MVTTLLASLAVAAALADGPPPPITVSLNDGGQYSRGDYAQVQFRANADGYMFVLQTDQDGRIRVLFPLDPGDDNFIRGGKTYKIVGRDNRGSFYLDRAGAGGMVYAAWSKSPFQFTNFVRADHWDYSVFDQYSASNDPESQLTDFVLNFTAQDFDYAIDRYVVYSVAEYSTDAPSTYIGVSAGWPWPSYYTGGWSIGFSVGYPCCYDPWPWYGYYPAYGWGYPGYGWGYPGYGWGYPGYGWGYPGYGWGYPVYGHGGYPGYGAGYPGYRPYTFKPGGTVTAAGNPYRPRGDIFAPRGTGFQTTYRDRSTYGLTGTGQLASDAATINGHSDAGRRPAARPASSSGGYRAGSNDPAQRGSGTARRPTIGSSIGATPATGSGETRRSPGTGPNVVPPMRDATPQHGVTPRARGWTADGHQLPATADRPRISPTPPSSGRSMSDGAIARPGATSGREQGDVSPARRPGSGNSQPTARPQSRPSGGQPAARPGGSGGRSPANGGGARSGGGGGGRGAMPSGGGGGSGGRRGR